jgi:hypothetical protein
MVIAHYNPFQGCVPLQGAKKKRQHQKPLKNFLNSSLGV